MRRSLIIGNWKMNGTQATIVSLVEELLLADVGEDVEVVLCPSSPYLYLLKTQLHGSDIALAAQDVSEFEAGAYTGETAASMLLDLGCRYSLVGHSERRELFAESDEQVARKALRLCSAGLTPVVCVGESLSEREAGEAEQVIAQQLAPFLEGVGEGVLKKSVIAYEPVWAIGTGQTATPDQAQAMHAFIRGTIAVSSPELARDMRVIYGGSMKPGNAGELLSMPDIDGGLVGGASLKAKDFLAIIDTVKHLVK